MVAYRVEYFVPPMILWGV